MHVHTQLEHVLYNEMELAVTNFNLKEGEDYRCKTETDGNVVKHYIDDELVLTVEYTTIYGGLGSGNGFEVPTKVTRHYTI